MRILIIPHSEDHDFNCYIICPDNLTLSEAQRKVDEVVKRHKTEDPEVETDSLFDRVETELLGIGFRQVNGWQHCEETI